MLTKALIYVFYMGHSTESVTIIVPMIYTGVYFP